MLATLSDHAQFERVGWRKGLLIPFWIGQVSILLSLMGIFSYRLAETLEHWDEMVATGDLPRVELVWEMTNIGFSLAALILTIIEIAKTVAETLTPFLMLCTHIIKLLVAFINLALDIVVYLKRSDHNYSIVGLALDCGLLAATLVTFTYSIRTFRRLQKYDDYALTGGTSNSKQLGLSGNNDVEMNSKKVNIFGNGKKSASSKVVSFSNASDTSYPSQTIGTTTNGSADPVKRKIDKTVGEEFGWGSGSPTHGTMERTDSFVAVGSVHHRLTQSSFDTVRRDSERGLVTVPEDEDDDDDTVRGSHDGGRQIGGSAGYQHHDSEDDRRALLVDGSRGGEFA